MAVLEQLRFWFRYGGRVSRRTYAVHGLVLAAAKYVLDAALIAAVLGLLWSPWDYVATGAALDRSPLAGAPAWLQLVLAAWTVPFVWIGHALTLRRAVDAGISPWWSLLFFVPLLNYLLIAVLVAAPSAARPIAEETEDARAGAVRTSEWPAIGVGAVAGLAMVAIGVLAIRSYGAGLFFGAPLVQGALTGYYLNRSVPHTSRETRNAVMLSFVVTGLILLLTAMEGMICVAMAFPLVAAVGIAGGAMGRAIAQRALMSAREPFVAVLVLPLVLPLFDATQPRDLIEVRSSIEIDAPADVVWNAVVAFPRLDAPREWFFRAGISYPIGARIEGEGVGALRYCEFSTGDFVEPITHWAPGRRLAFDVTRNPPALRELGPYDISPPHLDDYFSARRGEFRLIPLSDGGTRLEGSTWYELRIGPQVYWRLYADALVGRIHTRVLRHIREVAEARSAAL